MVAHPIQDMSEVSIAHKTVGIRLPRLRCGTIAETRRNDKTESSRLAKKITGLFYARLIGGVFAERSFGARVPPSPLVPISLSRCFSRPFELPTDKTTRSA